MSIKIYSKKLIIAGMAAVLALGAACAGSASGGEESLAVLSTLALADVPTDTCEGGLNLFTDPLPPEGEIAVIQLGQSIVLDRTTFRVSDPAWDFSIGEQYEGFYQRYARGVQSTACSTFTPLFPGYHYIKLCSMTDGYSCVARGFVKVEGVMNTPPNAELEPVPQVVFLGESATFDMSDSTDPEGDELHFEYRLNTKPSGSNVAVPNSGAAVQQFTPDVPGEYHLLAYARDGFENPLRWLAEQGASVRVISVYSRIQGNGAPNMTFDMTPPNPQPGQMVRLNAAASADPENETLTFYMWQVARLREDGVWELLDSQSSVPAGQLTADVQLGEAGRYGIVGCLADYVQRRGHVAGDEAACASIEFDVAGP